ncbi:carbohydrate-binding module family 20 domain-containing protein [Symbioplanes lichenis]|uniref:carbohydrate-binding module family 20 domain-containing protein n=1 Tax=Symbioplanes lichenis TaxID=1629072 RepID=UPI0027396968|nr:carbohydrate-binding module family 20 domain-containing protein [Actinoplanes lichenis]
MVDTCHAAGVKIYVDAVINHMAGGDSTGKGVAGTGFSHYSYPAVPYTDADFHHCGKNGNDDIVHYEDRSEAQNCELSDLADLKTEAASVRTKVAGYLNSLTALGVDGFRVDAAKHMPAADLQAIYGQLTGSPYIYQEVIEGAASEPAPEEYTPLGDVTEFRYGDRVSAAFRDGQLSGLQTLASSMRLPSGDAIAFIDNHDTQRNGSRPVLNYKDGTNYRLAEAFMIAYPYGVPQVMSGYEFSSYDQGPPSSADGTTKATDCSSGWVCEHRERTTANMVGLRNAAAGTGLTNWWSNGSSQIAFGRGDKAYVAFNRSGTALTRTFATGLPAGTYCDVMSGDVTSGTCTGTTVSVDGSGNAATTVPANGVVALHVNARVDAAVACAVSFASTTETTWGQNVFVVGSVPALGSWDPARAVPLSSASYPVWTGTVDLAPGQPVEYKYVKKEGDSVIWESDPNRSFTVPSDTPCALNITDSWR